MNTENPVLCDENLPQMVGMFEMFHARLMGVAHCIVPQILPIPIDTQGTALLQQPPIEFLQNIMQQPLLPDQMAIRAVPPSIVQIVVPMHSLPLVLPTEKQQNISIEETTTTIQPTVTIENVTSEELSTTSETPHNVEVSTQEPMHSSSPQIIITSSTTPFPEDDIDEMILNEDLDNEYHQGNEEVIKKQRDRSDFRYVESFEPEKSNVQQFEHDSEGANVINENFSQIPSVLPVPKALSSPKEVSSTELDEIPPDAMVQDDSEMT